MVRPCRTTPIPRRAPLRRPRPRPRRPPRPRPLRLPRRPPSPSISSAVGAATTLTTSISGSDTSVTPDGSVIEPAVNWVPISAPSTETVSCSGIDSASASISMVLVSWVTSVPCAASPSTTTLTSTVTFSPRRTTSRSACWMLRRIGWISSALVSASCSLPSMSRVSTALVPEWRSTAAKSWASSSRCCGSAAVAVEHRGHLAVAPGAARRALAGLGAYLQRSDCWRWWQSWPLVLLLLPVVVSGTARVATIRCGFPSITVAGTTLAVTPGAAWRRHRAQPGYPMNSSEREFGVRELLG